MYDRSRRRGEASFSRENRITRSIIFCYNHSIRIDYVEGKAIGRRLSYLDVATKFWKNSFIIIYLFYYSQSTITVGCKDDRIVSEKRHFERKI